MNNGVENLSLVSLSLAFIPVVVVLVMMCRWSLGAGNAAYAVIRMLVQLLLVGYFLSFIFESDSSWVVLLVLIVMVFASSWIGLGSVKESRPLLYRRALLAISLGGGLVLILVTQGVLRLEPWYSARYLIPLAGMIFASAMNAISLAAERLYAETERGVEWLEARSIACRAAFIPIVNAMFAVGLVSLPGMMTGQILSGVSPLVAARYQILVMCMIFGATGIATLCFIGWSRPTHGKNQLS
ncbi:MAG: ABC transporter permease [Porticoccaceae bacterium]|nr:ABC transporter permease [Porticoccaceae bacterium]